MKITITNKQIFDKLCDVEKHVIKTNGHVTLNKWISRTAMSLIIIIIGVLIYGV